MNIDFTKLFFQQYLCIYLINRQIMYLDLNFIG